jgi:uncharacterized membrane protein YeaQ/YmgE (transglycosylase-associated protein family)
MDFLLFSLSTSVLILLGIVGAFFNVKIAKKDLFGGMKVGIIVGIAGSILGGYLFDLFFKLPYITKLQDIPYIDILLVNKLDINFISSILGVWLFLYIYDYVSAHTERS